MRYSGLALAAVFALCFSACSSGSGDARAPSTGSGSCQGICDKGASLNCPNDVPGSCVADCEDGVASWKDAGCASQTSAYLGCIQSNVPMQCSSSGKSGIKTADIGKFCKTEASAVAGCAACVQDSNDDACDTCRKTACCSEWKAYSSDPSVFDFTSCGTGCSDTACINACFASYPSLKSKFDAMMSCESSKCASEC